MNEQARDKKLNFILFSLAAFFLCYTVIRAYLLGITWDEAYTYIEFARNGNVLPVTYNRLSANNHLLNTLLMIIFTKLFGENEFILRIPVLFAHVLFLYYSAKILRRVGKNVIVVVGGFIVINANPYLLDFFSLARGYGLSFGFMMASLYYFYQFHFHGNKNRNSVLSLCFAGLAVLSNFVMLNYFIVLLGLITALTIDNAIRKEETTRYKIETMLEGMIVPFILTTCLFLFVFPVIFKLKEAGAFFYGGTSGFWDETVTSSAIKYMYEKDYHFWLQRILKAGMLFTVLFSALHVTKNLIKKQLTGNQRFLGSLLLLLLLCSLSAVVQHYLMQTPYLIERTALFLVIIFSLMFVVFVSELSSYKKPFVFIMVIAALFSTAHFARAFNLNHVLDWKSDADTKEMLSDLEKIKKIPEGKKTASIGIPLTFDPAINFYRTKNNLTWLNTVWESETESRLQDYFYLSPESFSKIDKSTIEVIKEYPLTRNVLARPRLVPKRIRPLIDSVMTFKNNPGSSFAINETIMSGPAFSYIINDSVMAGKEAVITFSAEVKAPQMQNDNQSMIISFQDRSGKTYSWQYAYIKDFIRNENEWFEANFTCIVPSKIKTGDKLNVYISNPEKHNLLIRKQEFKWLAYYY